MRLPRKTHKPAPTPAFTPSAGFTGGRALRKRPGEMNKLEQSRAHELEAMRQSGEIVGWWFEALTLKLAADTRYTPDFLVVYPDGRQVIEEVKGRWEDDARAKIKVAADRFPWEFVGLTRRKKTDGGGWDREAFKGWSDEVAR